MENCIILGNHFAVIKPNAEYDYLDKTITGAEILKMDFSHITNWVDQKTITIEMEVWNRIPVCYHPEVHRSLMDEQEESPYWGIDIYDQLKIFKRMQHKYTAEKLREEEMKREVDLTTQVMYNKKTKIRNKLVDTLFIDRAIASDYLDEIIEKFGSGIMNYRVPEIVRKITDYKRL